MQMNICRVINLTAYKGCKRRFFLFIQNVIKVFLDRKERHSQFYRLLMHVIKFTF